jgi:hypothetical protein
LRANRTPLAWFTLRTGRTGRTRRSQEAGITLWTGRTHHGAHLYLAVAAEANHRLSGHAEVERRGGTHHIEICAQHGHPRRSCGAPDPEALHHVNDESLITGGEPFSVQQRGAVGIAEQLEDQDIVAAGMPLEISFFDGVRDAEVFCRRRLRHHQSCADYNRNQNEPPHKAS